MTKTTKKDEKRQIKELTLEDLKRVRGGLMSDETPLDDYNRDKCYKKCGSAIQ